MAVSGGLWQDLWEESLFFLREVISVCSGRAARGSQLPLLAWNRVKRFQCIVVRVNGWAMTYPWMRFTNLWFGFVFRLACSKQACSKLVPERFVQGVAEPIWNLNLKQAPWFEPHFFWVHANSFEQLPVFACRAHPCCVPHGRTKQFLMSGGLLAIQWGCFKIGDTFTKLRFRVASL